MKKRAPVAIERAKSAPPEEVQLGDFAALGPDVAANFAARGREDTSIVSPKVKVRREQTLLAELGGRIASLFSAVVPAPSAEKIDALEERALEVLESLMPKAIGGAEQIFDGWFVDLERRAENGGPINAMEYLTIVHVLRERLFEKSPELEPYVARMEKTRAAMRAKLGARAGDRLPRSYLAKQSRDVQAIHAAVFRPAEESISSTISNLAQNYLARPRDAVIAAGLLALCFNQLGVSLLAGAVHGYILGTFMEHAIHKHIGHASKPSLEKLEKILSKLGPIGRRIHDSIVETAFSHGTIHHASYAGDYVDRFAPRDRDQPAEAIEENASKRRRRSTRWSSRAVQRPPPTSWPRITGARSRMRFAMRSPSCRSPPSPRWGRRSRRAWRA